MSASPGTVVATWQNAHGERAKLCAPCERADGGAAGVVVEDAHVAACSRCDGGGPVVELLDRAIARCGLLETAIGAAGVADETLADGLRIAIGDLVDDIDAARKLAEGK